MPNAACAGAGSRHELAADDAPGFAKKHVGRTLRQMAQVKDEMTGRASNPLFGLAGDEEHVQGKFVHYQDVLVDPYEDESITAGFDEGL